MKCRRCGKYDTKVVDTRPTKKGTRRRVVCKTCGLKFTTYEVSEVYLSKLETALKFFKEYGDND